MIDTIPYTKSDGAITHSTLQARSQRWVDESHEANRLSVRYQEERIADLGGDLFLAADITNRTASLLLRLRAIASEADTDPAVVRDIKSAVAIPGHVGDDAAGPIRASRPRFPARRRRGPHPFTGTETGRLFREQSPSDGVWRSEKGLKRRTARCRTLLLTRSAALAVAAVEGAVVRGLLAGGALPVVADTVSAEAATGWARM